LHHTGILAALLPLLAACGPGSVKLGPSEERPSGPDTAVDTDTDTASDTAPPDTAPPDTAPPDTAPIDADGDGAPLAEDCDDTDPAQRPGARELCNERDDDCDGLVDGQDPDVEGATTWYRDVDMDGRGDAAQPFDACEQPRGYVPSSDDCDDADAGNACEGGTDTGSDTGEHVSDAGCAHLDASDPTWADCTCETWGGHDYVFCDRGVTWTEARDACDTIGAHLVVIDDSAEDVWLYDALLAIRATKWWIGLADLDHDEVFEWVYPQASGYTNWRRGEPTGGEYCVHHWYEWEPFAWNDEPCTDEKRWICEFESSSGTDTDTDTDGDSGGGDPAPTPVTCVDSWCLDLSDDVNRDHTYGPWTDNPSESFDVTPDTHAWTVADGSSVEFVVVDPATNGGASVLLTHGGETWRPSYTFPTSFTIDGEGASGTRMHVAGLASGWSDPSLFTGVAATMTLAFTDGTERVVELANGTNLDDWNHTWHEVSDAAAVRVYEDSTYGRHIDALTVELDSTSPLVSIEILDDASVHTGTAEKTSVAIFAITIE
jgi:hypothetical protein